MKARLGYLYLPIVTAGIVALATSPCQGFSTQHQSSGGSIVRSSKVHYNTVPNNHQFRQRTGLNLSLDDVDGGFIGGSLLWALNGYLGIDWLLAPIGVGLDRDFNPATRATTFLGKMTSGAPLDEALKGSQVLQDGERPEMGSRVGTGANVGYSVEGLEKIGDGDWLAQRDAGLSASAPIALQLIVTLMFLVLGVFLQAITHSTTTAGVLVIPALIYEIGRPSLPTKEEALLDLKIDNAVE